MKRLVIIFTIICIILTHCSCKSIDIGSIDVLLRKDANLSKKDNLIKIPIDPNEENGKYLLIASDFNDIDSTIFSFELINGVLSNIIEIEELKGNIIGYKSLRINNLLYWQFDISNHQGNGNSYFYSVDKGRVVFEIPNTVDSHFESANGFEYLNSLNFNTSNLLFDNESKTYPYSVVYANKKLNSYCDDINADGYDDLVFYGLILLVKNVSNNDYSNVVPTQTVTSERIFYFDKEDETFKYHP